MLSWATASPPPVPYQHFALTGQKSQQASGAGKPDIQRSNFLHSLLGPLASYTCKWLGVRGQDGAGLQLRDEAACLAPACWGAVELFGVPASRCSASQRNYSIPPSPVSGVSLFPFDTLLSNRDSGDKQIEFAQQATCK